LITGGLSAGADMRFSSALEFFSRESLILVNLDLAGRQQKLDRQERQLRPRKNQNYEKVFTTIIVKVLSAMKKKAKGSGISNQQEVIPC
jgi:hypothetical protein